MFAAERQAMIVEMLQRNGSVQVDALARELGVPMEAVTKCGGASRVAGKRMEKGGQEGTTS